MVDDVKHGSSLLVLIKLHCCLQRSDTVFGELLNSFELLFLLKGFKNTQRIFILSNTPATALIRAAIASPFADLLQISPP